MPRTMDEIKKAAFLESLERNQYNRTAVSREMCIGLRTVRIYIDDLRKEGHDIPDNANHSVPYSSGLYSCAECGSTKLKRNGGKWISK